MSMIKPRLADRIRQIRVERFGEEGAGHLAGLLGLPARTWANYEAGVTVPAPIMLEFIALTGASPLWLMAEIGPRYQRVPRSDPRAN